MPDSPLVTQMALPKMPVYIVPTYPLPTVIPLTVSVLVGLVFWLFIHPMLGLHMRGQGLTGN